MTEDMRDEIAEYNPNAAILTGHDNAIVGMISIPGRSNVVLYDPLKIIDNLMTNDGMTHEEATEWFSHNIECAWVGDGTPAMLVRLETNGGEGDERVEEDE
jgi:hypothetical protein